ncbi:MAG: DUF2017 family protein [Actinomycetota bacterium]
MPEHFRLVPEGVEVSLTPEEALVLGDVLTVLARMGDSSDDPGAARLHPPVYLDDPEADAEWRRLAGTELSAARRADRSAVEMVLEATETAHGSGEDPVISTGEAEALLRVLNDVRLVLAARWGVDSPDAYDRLRPEAADVLSFLGWLVSELAIVLGGGLSGGEEPAGPGP